MRPTKMIGWQDSRIVSYVKVTFRSQRPTELSVAKQLVLQGTRIVLPESLQPDVISFTHEGHQTSTKMKQYLRARV